MTYGLIDRRGREYYTFLSDVLRAIGQAQCNYNWLIADVECVPKDEEIAKLFQEDSLWLSGAELTALIEKEDFQWIWGILCGFAPEIARKDVLEYPLPSVRDYNEYYRNPVQMQHPLASVEIVACDSSWLLMVTKEKQLYDDYWKANPDAEDLAEANAQQA